MNKMFISLLNLLNINVHFMLLMFHFYLVIRKKWFRISEYKILMHRNKILSLQNDMI